MAKVSIKKQQYKLTDFSKWVKCELIKNDMTQQDLAVVLGITAPAMSYKLKHNQFSLEDIMKICTVYQPKAEVLRDLLII